VQGSREGAGAVGSPPSVVQRQRSTESRTLNPEPLRFLDLLTSLVDRSLVVVETGTAFSGSRFRFLETTRAYARERLVEAGEEEAAREQHAAYFLRMAETAAPRLIGPEDVETLNHLQAAGENLQTA